jgi:hypothetical protein
MDFDLADRQAPPQPDQLDGCRVEPIMHRSNVDPVKRCFDKIERWLP